MTSYGYSVWLVPANYDEIKRKYKMRHIPHVTISTNYQYIPKISDDNTYDIKLKHGYEVFPKMYKSNDIDGGGFYCEIPICTKHEPHMTIYYDAIFRDLPIINEIIEAKIHIADTRSCDPSKWLLKS